MEEKTYYGSVKEIETQYGKMMKLSFSEDDLTRMSNDVNEKGYINLNMSERKEVSQYGHTHSISLDTWKPE
jgi:hypothetical protein